MSFLDSLVQFLETGLKMCLSFPVAKTKKKMQIVTLNHSDQEIKTDQLHDFSWSRNLG